MTGKQATPTPGPRPTVLNVALLGGGDLCIELLRKTTFEQGNGKASARIVAVSDPDPEAPCMGVARDLGLKTETDYRRLYDPLLDIHLIIVLIPDDRMLLNILDSRPPHIRILSCEVFTLFWEAIGREEQKLRKRNREVEAILNGIQDYIVVISAEKEIVDVNEAFLKGTGYARSEVIGRKCYEVFQKTRQMCSGDSLVCPQLEALHGKMPSQRVMTRVNRRGEKQHVEISIYPIWKSDGRISEFIEISRDITDRKRQEEEITQRLEHLVAERTQQLQETQDKLIHQDKMASLGKLAASVVHEINNPNAGILNLIVLIKRIIREGPVTDKEMAQFTRYLDLMETENRRISRIVSNLLAFSRQSKVVWQGVNLNQLIERTLLLNANQLKINGVRLDKRLADDLPEHTGSEDQLQQVFMNLVSNAAEAMHETSKAVLTIETAFDPDTRTLRVSFSDTGIGIPEANLSRLFEPFFTTKKKGKGVGLGLSVAYGIIQEHGGSIHVRSSPGQGAVFTVELPLKPSAG